MKPMAKKDTIRYSVSFVIRRMQINATMTYHYIPTRMAETCFLKMLAQMLKTYGATGTLIHG